MRRASAGHDADLLVSGAIVWRRAREEPSVPTELIGEWKWPSNRAGGAPVAVVIIEPWR